ncbi:MAG: aminopeptidase N [Cryomorphaceae bacterium]|jgi:aminopeptidase N
MRYLLVALYTIVSLPIVAQHDVNTFCKDLSHIVEMEKKGKGQLLNFKTNEATQNYDLKYHRMEWTVDPAENYISGEITSYFVPTEDEFQQINFDFADNMTIVEVRYGSELLNAQQADDNLKINLPEILPIGQLDSISVKYEGAPNSTGFGSFIQGTHNGIPILWTLSEPYGAKVWWPCKQDLTDKIDSVDIIVKTPDAYRVGSNGKLISEIPEGDLMVYHWKHRYPITAYLVAIAVTNYEVFSDFVEIDNGAIEVLNYVFPEDLSQAEDQLESTVEIMELFNELFEIYPFADEKYGHAQFGWGGGMEHQTMSFMGSFSYGLQAHELAHQWFGDKVTCGSWEDIWLNEGFATYLTGLTSEFLGTSSEWYDWKLSQINSIVSVPYGSVWVDDTTSVGRIFSSRLSYSKGAYLLHMLRWKLGDEDFFQATRNYLDDPDLAFSYARTIDLKAHLESQSGQDLTEYFEDWFYGQGYPSYDIDWYFSNNSLNLQIEQSTSHSSVDYFEMHLPIYVTGQGQDSIIRLDHNFSGQTFEIDLPFVVEQVQFDPSLWLVSANNSVQEVNVSQVRDSQYSNGIRLSPNPTENQVKIVFSDKVPEPDRIEVYNESGMLLESLSSIPSDYTLILGDWPAGAYHIAFYWQNEKVSKTIIKK